MGVFRSQLNTAVVPPLHLRSSSTNNIVPSKQVNKLAEKMKFAAIFVVVLCAVQFTSAGFFQKFQEKLSPSLNLRLPAIPQSAKDKITKAEIVRIFTFIGQ